MLKMSIEATSGLEWTTFKVQFKKKQKTKTSLLVDADLSGTSRHERVAESRG